MEWQQNQSNSTGVFLEITEGRSLYFTPRETLIFGYLFDLADTDDDGLVGANDGGHALLGRARLPPSTLQRLWAEAGGESPEECLARPQWFVLLALVALAQAGLPCTLRDLLNTCDVVSAVRTAPNPPPAQAFQQQQQQQQLQQGGGAGGGSGGNGGNGNNAGRQRPIPEFFLDGVVVPPAPSSPSTASPRAIADAAATASPSTPGGTATGPTGGELARNPAGGGNQQQQQRGGSRRGRKGDAPGSRGAQQEKVEAWDYGGGGGAGWEGGGPGRGVQDPNAAGGGGGDGGGGGYQLEVTVYSHRVVGEGYGSHTEYTVLTNASLPGFARREMEVARRFSDFRWLHSCFRAIPGVLPPPLPPSKWAGSSSRDFVAERMKGLQRYMTRVAQHPILSRHYAFQVFLEGTPRGLRAAKALLPVRVPGSGSGSGGGSGSGTVAWGDTFSPSMAGTGGTPVSPALSSTPSTTPPDESAGGNFVRRRFSLGGADDMYIPGGGAGGGAAAGGGGGSGGVGPRQGQRRSVSFGGSSDDSSCNGGSGHGVGGAGAGGWTGSAAGWPLSVVANVGYEAYGNYMSTSVSTSLTSIKGVLGAVKTKAKSVVGLGAGPAPIAVEQDPLYDAEVARIEELVAPVAGSVKIMESAAVLKRGVGYEMSRLGHYLTQVASLEDTDGLPAAGATSAGDDGSAEADGLAGGAGVAGGASGGGGGGGSRAGWAKTEQVLGQRMERVATAWLEAIDQEESDFLDPLREQLGYLASAKEVHRGRGRALDALQAGNASLQRNKQRLHAARAQGDAHMASVSTAKMDAAEERMTRAQTRAGLITKTFKGEARRFHECRRAEGVLAVLELARAQALFARKANAAWKQVLEDINPTDDELRESQQRVRLPKREARIGEAAGRPGSSTAGVIGGWLGAAATVGLSTASAGLSTVTGVAGATASAGLSTVTGVAGAMAGRASGAVSGGGAGKDAADAGRESGPVPSSGGGGGVTGAASAEPTGESPSPGPGPMPNGVVLGGGGDGRGHGNVEALESGGPGVVSRGVPSAARAGEFGAPRGGSGGGRVEESDQLEEVDVQTTATGSVPSVAPSSSSSHQLNDGSWELNLEQPTPPEAASEQADPIPSAVVPTGTSEARSPPGSELLAAAVDDGGFGSLSSSPPAAAAAAASSGGGDAPESSSPGSGEGGLSKAANNRARRLARREAVAAAVAAARSGNSTSGSGEAKGGGEGAVAGKLVSLSLDEGAPATIATSSPPSGAKGNGAGAASGSSRPSVATTTTRGPATALSLMDSLDALSSSGADSVPEVGGSGSSGGVGRGGDAGESKGHDGSGGAGFSSSSAAAADVKPPPAAEEVVVVAAATTSSTTTSTGSNKKKKKGRGGVVTKQAVAAAAGSKPAASSSTPKQQPTAASKAEETKSKPTISLADGGAASDDAGTDPATGSGSGSGSSSGGFGPVSAATTVVRLAGSPNPPLDRGGSSRGGSGAENGLRRLAPNGGRGGGARGRVKS